VQACNKSTVVFGTKRLQVKVNPFFYVELFSWFIFFRILLIFSSPKVPRHARAVNRNPMVLSRRSSPNISLASTLWAYMPNNKGPRRCSLWFLPHSLFPHLQDDQVHMSLFSFQQQASPFDPSAYCLFIVPLYV
jgi:hypothetical protein